jgi:hypothetical protein
VPDNRGEAKAFTFHTTALQEIYEARARYHHYWAVGQREWRLLYGEDLLASLTVRSGEALHLGLLCTISTYCWPLINTLWSRAAPNPDRVLAASVCYRIAASLLQLELELLEDRPTEGRAKTLAAAREARPEEGAFLGELERLDAARFLREEPGLEDRTVAFLLRRLNEIMRRLPEGSFATPAPGLPRAVRHEPDGSLDEVALSAAEAAFVDRVVGTVRAGWPGYRAAYLAPTVYHSIGDLVLALEIDADRPPSAALLGALREQVRAEHPPGVRRTLLYLLLPAGAVHVGIHALPGRVERLLQPAVTPDFFALVQRPELRLDGQSSPPEPPPYFTPAALHFLREPLWRLEHPNWAPGREEPERRDLAARFWKRVQVALVERSLASTAVRYPVTPAAIERALAATGRMLPGTLAPLRDAVLDPAALPRAETLAAEADRFAGAVLGRE